MGRSGTRTLVFQPALERTRTPPYSRRISRVHINAQPRAPKSHSDSQACNTRGPREGEQNPYRASLDADSEAAPVMRAAGGGRRSIAVLAAPRTHAALRMLSHNAVLQPRGWRLHTRTHGPGRTSTDRSRRERDGDGSQKAALGPRKADASAVYSHARPRDTPRYAARCAEIVFTARSHRVGRGGAPLMQTRRRPRRRRRRAARATRARRGAYRTVRGTASLSDS